VCVCVCVTASPQLKQGPQRKFSQLIQGPSEYGDHYMRTVPGLLYKGCHDGPLFNCKEKLAFLGPF